jgi:hypothetical protein
VTHRLFGGESEGVDQASDLAAAVANGLAGLDAQALRQLFEAFLEALHTVLQHGLTLVTLERTHRRRSFDRGRDRSVDRRFVGERDAGRDLTAVLVGNLELRVRVDGLVGEVIRIRFFEHGPDAERGAPPVIMGTSLRACNARTKLGSARASAAAQLQLESQLDDQNAAH